MLTGTLFPIYQQACYIVQPRSAYRVSLYGFGHVIVRSFYHLSVQPLFVRPPFGGVANALGTSDFARYFSWNLAILPLRCPIVRSIAVNYLLFRVAFRDRCIYLEPPLFLMLTI